VAVLIAAGLVFLSGFDSSIAMADSGNTSAVAVNTRNGSSLFRLTFAIRRVTGGVVDNQNIAVAYSNCTACQTVAIAIQVLLISGDVTMFAPTNEAIAINQNCDLCDTVAEAYQFAVAIGTRLKFTADGRQQIAQIRRQLEHLRKSGLTGPQLADQVSALMGQLGNVLQTQLVGTSGPAGNGTAKRAAGTPSNTAAPSSAPPDTPAAAAATPTATTPASPATSPTAPTSTSTTPSTTASPATTTVPATTTPTTTTTPTSTTPATTTPTSTTTATTPAPTSTP
jgi:hypothetical protein